MRANRTLALIRKMYNFAIERDLIENNPCYMVKAPSKEHSRDRAYTDDEIKKLWNAFEKLTPLMRDHFRLRLVTAQRGIEILSMQWKNVDFEKIILTIPPEVVKNES